MPHLHTALSSDSRPRLQSTAFLPTPGLSVNHTCRYLNTPFEKSKIPASARPDPSALHMSPRAPASFLVQTSLEASCRPQAPPGDPSTGYRHCLCTRPRMAGQRGQLTSQASPTNPGSRNENADRDSASGRCCHLSARSKSFRQSEQRLCSRTLSLIHI